VIKFDAQEGLVFPGASAAVASVYAIVLVTTLALVARGWLGGGHETSGKATGTLTAAVDVTSAEAGHQSAPPQVPASPSDATELGVAVLPGIQIVESSSRSEVAGERV